jgi:predicted RNA-binding Zn-ribbon protein involved in translation (DUF1610 family)
MEGNGIKIGLIVSVALAVCLSIGMAVETMWGGEGGGSADTKIWFKCANPACNAAYSLTVDEFQKLQGDNPMMMMPGQQMAYKCQKCGQQSAYVARKCPKCGEVFVMQMGMSAPGQQNQDYPDKCPKCGYSAMEEMAKKEQQQP